MARERPLQLGLVEHRVPRVRQTLAERGAWDQWEAYRKSHHSDAALFDEMGAAAERPPRFQWLVISLAFQAIVIAGITLQSVMSESSLPEPRMVQTFMAAAPPAPIPPPPPPPPKAVSRTSTGTSSTPRRIPSMALVAPTTIDMPFDGFTMDDMGVFEDTGGGVPGGVVDGVVGGLVGGVGSGPPPEAPKERTAVRIGGSIKPPEKVNHVDPIYPDVASAARVAGLVILEATIDGAGVVQNLRVLKSIPLLDQAAIDAVREWRYTPTVIDGIPVSVLMTVTVSFTL